MGRLPVGFIPATEHVEVGAVVPALQRISVEDTLVTGLLLAGLRTQELCMSVLPTHSCCQVAWAEVMAAMLTVSARTENFIVCGVRE